MRSFSPDPMAFSMLARLREPTSLFDIPTLPGVQDPVSQAFCKTFTKLVLNFLNSLSPKASAARCGRLVNLPMQVGSRVKRCVSTERLRNRPLRIVSNFP